MKGTLRLGVGEADDGEQCVVLELDGTCITLSTDEAGKLFNALGDIIEDLGYFAECNNCPNKDDCTPESECVCDKEPSCLLH